MDVKILSSLVTERLGNRLWGLVEPFKFTMDGVEYAVPRGFVVDGASCPRPLWAICAPVAGPFGEAAVIHDYFYSPEGPDLKRKKADKALYAFGRYRGAGWIRGRAVESGVRAFGWKFFKADVEKLTEKSCYDLEAAKLRVTYLKWCGSFHGCT